MRKGNILFSKEMFAGGEEGDGTDLYGNAPYWGVHTDECQNLWHEPEQLAALLAKEEPDIDDEDENLGDDTDEILDDEGEARIDYEVVAMREINPAEVVAATELMEPVEHVPGEDDTRQGGVIGLGRLAHTELGYYGGAGFHKDSTDQFRQHRQAVTRPRKDGAKAKEAMIAA